MSNKKQEIEFTLNGKKVKAIKGETIYNASVKLLPNTQRIPVLCHHPYLPVSGNCRICLVQQNFKSRDGKQLSKLVSACNTVVSEGMEIITNSKQVEENIKGVLSLLLSNHPLDCPNCLVNGDCVFQDLLGKYDISPQTLDKGLKKTYLENVEKLINEKTGNNVNGNNAIKLDTSKCIKCTRCIRVCECIQCMNVLGMKDKGKEENISCFKDFEDFNSSDCVSCAQCTFVCPVGALTVSNDVPKVNKMLKDKTETGFTLVCQTAPAVRVTIAEAFGLKPGDITEGQMVTALRQLGFDVVFDTNFTADLTIIEEGNELIQRVKKGGPFPMFTSCCPAWINLCETQYPQFNKNLSTCKSPQQMLGALVKKYWAKKVGKKPHKIFCVSIMPCGAKKDECKRQQMLNDVDVVLTTRELGRLFKLNKINPSTLKESIYDDPLGESTGAAVIFGATGGVMEAALRTAYEVLTGTELPGIDYKTVRGLEGIKTAEVKINKDLTIKIAVAHQIRNMKALLKRISEGEQYHFVEFMCCPGGCIGGGGNPKLSKDEKSMNEFLQKRVDAIYGLDKKMVLRKSHANPSVTKLYDTFLKKPLGHHSHQLLHTHYNDRSKK